MLEGMIFRIRTSPKNYVCGFNVQEGTLRRTDNPENALRFYSEAGAREWWSIHAPTLPDLPPLGEGETLRLESAS
jgi:hypothetical protein